MIYQTFNPINTPQSYENSIFSPIPIPPAGFAFVLTSERADSAPLTIQAGEIPVKQQIRAGKYNKKTLVDIQRHLVAFGAEALARDSVSKFQIEVSMLAQVQQPDRVLAEQITDVTSMIKSALLPRLQRLACEKGADEPQALRGDILGAIGDVSHLDCGIMLTDINVTVELDHATADHFKSIRKLQYTGEYEEARAAAAIKLSQLYQNPVTQVFAECASGELTAEEAAKRLKANSADDFNEQLRRIQEVAAVVKKMQEDGINAPGALSGQADKLIGMLVDGAKAAMPAGNAVQQKLESGISEQQEYLPPED